MFYLKPCMHAFVYSIIIELPTYLLSSRPLCCNEMASLIATYVQTSNSESEAVLKPRLSDAEFLAVIPQMGLAHECRIAGEATTTDCLVDSSKFSFSNQLLDLSQELAAWNLSQSHLHCTLRLL